MKILSWNIEKFTNNKLEDVIYNPSTKWTKRPRIVLDAIDRLYYMRETVRGAGNAAYVPDVIAILEVLADSTLNVGDPLDAASAAGIIGFLKYVKFWTGNANWRLVPPLKCNPANVLGGNNVQHEVVGVLYDSARVNFLGPVVHGPYAAPWNKVSVTGGTNLAGQIRFYHLGVEIDFPANYHRRPFMVDFQENFGAHRRIRCLFSHTSPGYHVGGTQAIAQIQEMAPAGGGGAPDLCVAAGDFNVNDWNLAQSTASYAPIQALNYTKQLGVVDHSTHFRRKKEAVPNAVIPTYGYMQHEVIDNFLVRPTPPGVLPACTHAAVNEVAGDPHPPYNSVMTQTLAVLNANPASIANFRQWQNFWSIVATSDHAPIFLEIP